MEASEPVSESRAARRAARDERRRNPVLPPMATERRVPVVLATAVLALLLALATAADHALGAAAVAWLGLALAWGWPELLGSPSRFGSSLAVGVAGVLAPVTVAFTPDDPYLRHVPVVVAAAVLTMFLHQVVRKDGRPRLTQSVAISAAGIAVATIGVAWVPLGRTSDGAEVALVVAVALAVSALADLLAPLARVRPWMVAIAGVLGLVAGGVGGLVVTEVGALGGAVIGAVAAGLAHVMRRALCVLPPIRGLRGQLTAAAASVLVTGVPVGVLAAVFVG
ncbi:hypothetical protein GCM10022415_07740 [Knoellia locipacati]|uniref:Uncharacterized protein n=1 Tax=Knoellia locipacati TaxID=882824 RepID=A0A512SXT4_9MICO|nr:hypothetical protein [Knoellia locipacati]GEQ12725.1 hypothetical protein KLO01_07720 [Knoellia locipacati]